VESDEVLNAAGQAVHLGDDEAAGLVAGEQL
jgi:hypothetical protein